MPNSYIIFGGCSGEVPIPSSRNFYFAFGGNLSFFTIGAGEIMAILPAPGYISDFYVEQETAPGSGEGIVWSLIRNTIPQIEVTIEDTDTQGSNTTDSFHFDSATILDNMTVGIVATDGTSPASTRVRWSFKWTPDTAGYSILCAGCGNRVLDTTTRYACLAGRFDAGISNTFPADEDVTRLMVSTPGTFRNLTVRVQDPPGTGNTRVFTLRKNAADTSQTVTITGTGIIPIWGQDSANSVAVVAGDIINVKCTSTGTPPDSRAQISVVFEGTNKNEYIIPLTSDGDMPRTGNDTFCSLWEGRDRYQTTNESRMSILANRGDGLLRLKNMYVELTASPGFNRSYIFRVRKNQVTTGIVESISGGSTTGNVTADVFLDSNDLLTMNQDSTLFMSTRPNASKASIACTAEFIPATVIIRGGNILGANIAV